MSWLARWKLSSSKRFEPPQNRRRGDDFGAVEYIQDVDPELKEQELQRTLRNIEHKLREVQK